MRVEPSGGVSALRRGDRRQLASSLYSPEGGHDEKALSASRAEGPHWARPSCTLSLPNRGE